MIGKYKLSNAFFKQLFVGLRLIDHVVVRSAGQENKHFWVAPEAWRMRIECNAATM